MKPLFYTDVAGQQVTTHATNVLKLEYSVDSAAAAGWIQIHDSQLAPATGAVPLKSWPTSASDVQYKEFKNGELHISNGLYVAFSTTEATFTLGTGSNKFDNIMIELSEAEQSVTVVGDLTTTVQQKEIWAESAGPKRLTKLQVVFGPQGNEKYAMLFAKDSPIDGDTPIEILGSGDNQTKVFDFGSSGLAVFSQDADGTDRVGCTIAISTTLPTLTQGLAANCIRAEYI